jgi:hypothetical protein
MTRERVICSKPRVSMLLTEKSVATYAGSGDPYILTHGAVGTISSVRGMSIVREIKLK